MSGISVLDPAMQVSDALPQKDVDIQRCREFWPVFDGFQLAVRRLEDPSGLQQRARSPWLFR